MSRRFARNGWPRGSEVVSASTMTASATPHTKGPWVDLDASVSRDICGFVFTSTGVFTTGVDTSTLLDIGVGSTGDAVDQTKVANIPVGGINSLSPFFVPLHVRAGERIAGRIQSVVISKTMGARLAHCFADRPPGWGGFSEADTYGVNTATSGPTTGDLADNAWDEAVASTTNSIKGLTFHPCMVPADITLDAVSIDVDIGVGGAGSEIVLGQYNILTQTSEQVNFTSAVLFIEYPIAAGSRLAIRKNTTSDLSGALIGWR